MDGNWIDMLTVTFGVAGLFIKPIIRWSRGVGPCWVHRDAINDFLNAASLAPFVLLLIAVFHSQVLAELVASSKVSLSLAGGIGTLYVLKELFSIEPA